MQLRGFGVTMDLERGTMRSWVVGDDGVKRWADNSAPVIPGPDCERMVVAQLLDIKPQTVRVYMSKKSGKAPSMVLISLFSLKLKSPQVR